MMAAFLEILIFTDEHRMADGGVPRELGAETGGGHQRVGRPESKNGRGDGEPGEWVERI